MTDRTQDALSLFQTVRERSTAMCAPLELEDYTLQSMPDASPWTWHLAHTTWFFDTFVVQRDGRSSVAPDPSFHHLYNSYYNGVGTPYSRERRGLISRPGVRGIVAYRAAVDSAVREILESGDDPEVATLVTLGCNHEQQHQELMLTDLLHAWSFNPCMPVYDTRPAAPAQSARDIGWVARPEAVTEVGHEGAGFHYDNEAPRHRVLVHAHEMADRLVNNAEWMAFIEDGGYERPELWLAEGWATVQAEEWAAPLYWQQHNGVWTQRSLQGEHEIAPAVPVAHVSHFEADAYARWVGVRLPTEFEWETYARSSALRGNLAEDGALAPRPPSNGRHVFGDLWQWTSSSYAPYPGYAPPPGALGEYNGKFMSNQYVLRGGSFATSQRHIRDTYRNFFPSSARWQFSGVRLCRDAQ
ncbi:MAG: ergothioneine biosynthesis protein EgtB [Bradymonadia bacterium]|jgi:ergothioneine biosynthesis protein EgtB